MRNYPQRIRVSRRDAKKESGDAEIGDLAKGHRNSAQERFTLACARGVSQYRAMIVNGECRMVNWGAIVRGAVISVLLIATQVTAQDDHHLVDPMKFVPSVDSVPMPVLEFTTSPEIESNFDKYYYFYREDTSFEEALGDLRECDGFARGLSSNYAYTQAPYPYTYTAAGAVGGALGNAMVAVIFGSAEKRRIRRVNMRRCMGYKGYGRFGLEKGLWQAFNFEEGFSSEREETRQSMLAQQAKVASQARPTTQELGL